MRGLGPVYVATERRCPVRARLSRAWITEMAPPYRKGKGWRLRVGHLAVQVGVCRKNDVDEEHLIEHLGWRRLGEGVEDIRQW